MGPRVTVYQLRNYMKSIATQQEYSQFPLSSEYWEECKELQPIQLPITITTTLPQTHFPPCLYWQPTSFMYVFHSLVFPPPMHTHSSPHTLTTSTPPCFLHTLNRDHLPHSCTHSSLPTTTHSTHLHMNHLSSPLPVRSSSLTPSGFPLRTPSHTTTLMTPCGISSLLTASTWRSTRRYVTATWSLCTMLWSRRRWQWTWETSTTRLHSWWPLHTAGWTLWSTWLTKGESWDTQHTTYVCTLLGEGGGGVGLTVTTPQQMVPLILWSS